MSGIRQTRHKSSSRKISIIVSHRNAVETISESRDSDPGLTKLALDRKGNDFGN